MAKRYGFSVADIQAIKPRNISSWYLDRSGHLGA